MRLSVTPFVCIEGSVTDTSMLRGVPYRGYWRFNDLTAVLQEKLTVRDGSEPPQLDTDASTLPTAHLPWEPGSVDEPEALRFTEMKKRKKKTHKHNGGC